MGKHSAEDEAVEVAAPLPIPKALAPGPSKVRRSRRSAEIALSVVAAVVILTFIVLAVWAKRNGSPSVQPRDDKAASVRALCEKEALDRLVDDTDASASVGQPTERAGGDWTASGTIKAQNAFGVLIQKTMTCQASPEPNGQWYVVVDWAD